MSGGQSRRAHEEGAACLAPRPAPRLPSPAAPPPSSLHSLGKLMREQAGSHRRLQFIVYTHMASPSTSPTVSASNLPTTCVINCFLASSGSHSFTIGSRVGGHANAVAFRGRSVPSFCGIAARARLALSASTPRVISGAGTTDGRQQRRFGEMTRSFLQP